MPIIHSDGSTAGTLDEQGNLTLAGDYAWAVYPPAVAGLISILATGFLLTYIICARRTKLSNTGTVLVINILIAGKCYPSPAICQIDANSSFCRLYTSLGLDFELYLGPI